MSSNPFDTDSSNIVQKSTQILNEIDIPESDKAPTTPIPNRFPFVTNIDGSHSTLNKKDFIQFLFQNGFILTALEFYQELLENGDTSSDLEALHTFFVEESTKLDETLDILPSSFSSQKSSRPTDPPFSQQLLKKDEQIALLEYELRLAKEDLSQLREETKSLKIEKQFASDSIFKDPTTLNKRLQQAPELSAASPLSVSEKQNINYVLNNYLVLEDFKLTSITFAEEAQKVDSWDKTASHWEPPDLASLYRYFYSKGPNKKMFVIRDELRASKTEYDALWSDFCGKVKQNESLEQRITELEDDGRALREKIYEFERTHGKKVGGVSGGTRRGVSGAAAGAGEKTREPGETNQDDEDEDETMKLSPLARRKREARKKRSKFIVDTQTRETAAIKNQRVADSLEKIATLERDNQSAVRIVADALPHIIPAVLLNTREELIPVLLCTIRQHPDAKVRDSLTQSLFNLIKIPDASQRKVIMQGCVALSRIIGRQRTADELLPQCWEQINHKYQERRVLVAESCGVLSKYVQRPLRSSLIFSILRQLLEDKSEMVRVAVARNLAGLVACWSEKEKTKYKEMEDVILALLFDIGEEVGKVVLKGLLPVFLDWADLLGEMWTGALSSLLTNLENLTVKKDEREGRKMRVLISALVSSVPRMTEGLLLSAPFTIQDDPTVENEILVSSRTSLDNIDFPTISTTVSPGPPVSSRPSAGPIPAISTADLNEDSDSYITISKPDLKILISKLNRYIEKRQNDVTKIPANGWQAFDWLVFVCVPRLIAGIVSHSSSRQTKQVWNPVTKGVADICYALGSKLGISFVRYVLKPLFLGEIQKEMNVVNNSMNVQPGQRGNSVVPREQLTEVYVIGILPLLGHREMSAYLRNLIVKMAMNEEGWDVSNLPLLFESVEVLVSNNKKHVGVVAGVLAELVKHANGQVREVVVKVLDRMSGLVGMEEMRDVVVPAVMTLSNDVENAVKLASVRPLGNLTLYVTEQASLDKISVQFDALADSGDYKLTLAVVNMFAEIIPTVKAKFRDSYILPKLVSLSERNNRVRSRAKRGGVAAALFDAFRAFHGCSLSEDTIRNGLIPGLECLNRDVDILEPSYKNMIRSMIIDMKRAVREDTAKEEKERDKDKDQKEGNKHLKMGIGLSMEMAKGITHTVTGWTPDLTGVLTGTTSVKARRSSEAARPPLEKTMSMSGIKVVRSSTEKKREPQVMPSRKSLESQLDDGAGNPFADSPVTPTKSNIDKSSTPKKETSGAGNPFDEQPKELPSGGGNPFADDPVIEKKGRNSLPGKGSANGKEEMKKQLRTRTAGERRASGGGRGKKV